MIRIIFLLFSFYFLVGICIYAQPEMKVEDPSNQWNSTVQLRNIERIDSLIKLPAGIQFKIKNHLFERLGNLSNYVTLYQGKIYNLDAIFKSDSNVHKLYSIIPKYELNFMIIDTSIGFIRYNLILELDEYGQVLKMNWPRYGYDDKSKFVSRNLIEKYAVEQAKLKGYFHEDPRSFQYGHKPYQIDFRFDEKEEKLIWIFSFDDPALNNNCWIYWNVLEIDWISMRITDEYPKRFTPCY